MFGERSDLMNKKLKLFIACLLLTSCALDESILVDDIGIANTQKNFDILTKNIDETTQENEVLKPTIYNKEEQTTNNEEIATDKTKKTPSLLKEEAKTHTENIEINKEKQTIVSTSTSETTASKPKETKTTKTESKPKNPDLNKTESTNPEIETKEDTIVTTKDSCQGSGTVFQGNEICANALNTSYGEIVNLYPGSNKGFEDARNWAIDKFITDYNGKYLDTYNIDYVEFTDGKFYYVVQFTYIDLEA